MSDQSTDQDTETQILLDSSPRLDEGVDTLLQFYRGQTWYLLVDQLTNNQILIDQGSYQLLQQFEQGLTLQSALDLMIEEHNIEIPVADAIALLNRLHEARMLRGDLTPDLARSTNEDRHPSRWRTILANPTAIRVPLFNPESLLLKLQPLASMLISRVGAWTVGILLVIALTITMTQWSSLNAYWDSRFLDPGNLILLVLLYPIIKLIHELGHGLTARKFGAQVNEIGVLLLVFFPVPYVDATQSATLHNSKHRMLIAAAGILIELSIAAFAVVLWYYLETGLMKDLAFNVAVLAGFSTLLFNGNPLLRFDGYYVLMDAIEMPNLGPRASQHLGYLFRTRILGLEETPQETGTSERRWLFWYGMLSACYRLVISFAIAIYIASRFFIVGLLLAIWFIFSQILRPYVRFIKNVLGPIQVQQKAARSLSILAVITVVVPLLILFVPVQHSTAAYGVILPPESSIIRSETDGFLESIPAIETSLLEPGDLVANLSNADLRDQVAIEQLRLQELEAEFRLALVNRSAETSKLKEDVERQRQVLETAESDLGKLAITSPVAGQFQFLTADIQTGRWIKRGTIVGIVAGNEEWTATVLVDESSISNLNTTPRKISVLPVSEPSLSFTGTLDAQSPKATQVLPQKSLSSLFGGPISVDISEEGGTKLLSPMFEVNVLLPRGNYRAGQTVLVWFLHNRTPIGKRLLDWLSRNLELLLNQYQLGL